MGHLAALGQAKRTKVKRVDDPLLNRCGLQVARTLVARGSQLSRRYEADELARPYEERFRHEGLVVIPDFVSGDELDRLVEGCEALLDDDSVAAHEYEMGDNVLRSIFLKELDPEQAAVADVVNHDPRLWSLVSMAERRPVGPELSFTRIDRFTTGPGDVPDPENALHSDTFFSTVKCWLYLHDVTLDTGPLEFVPGSHRLDWRHLRGVYQHSLESDTEASRRIPASEAAERGLPAPVALTCTAGTLAMADTFGYHHRLRGKPGEVREAVHFQIRGNPFRRAQPAA